VEEHVRQVARRLVADGVAVEVWAVERDGGHRVTQVDGIVVRHLPTPLPARSARAMGRFATAAPAAWRHWVRAYREFAPDVLHVHCFGPNGIYALRTHRRFGVPLIVTSHGETFMDDNGVFQRSALLRRSLREAIAAADAVTGCSQLVVDDLRAFGLVDGQVVPNGVDMDVTPRPGDADIDQHTFVAVGRLGRTKGFDLLIDAFGHADLPDDVRLAIVGDGPEREALSAQISRLGLGDRIALLGARDPQGVADAMSAALAVVVPSRVEAFGIVVLEAWRSGAVLVTTRHIGAPVRDGVDALTVDPADTGAFAGVLRRVATEPALRATLATAGSRRVTEFTWDAVVDAYRHLYEASRTGLPQ
jgi:glycosyltransferase involved in cell wall biosynthesis